MLGIHIGQRFQKSNGIMEYGKGYTSSVGFHKKLNIFQGVEDHVPYVYWVDT